MKKRLLSILLVLVMALSVLPVTAHAMEHWNLYCKTCKKDVLNKDGAEYVYVDGTSCKYVTKCLDCGSELSLLVYHRHSGSETPTCTTGIICDNCGQAYGALGHDWRYASNGDGTHTRTCQREGCGVTEKVNCSGGEATCIAKAVCKDCGAEYGEKDLSNHTGGTATCTEKAVCQRCGERYGEINPNNHTGGTATCTKKAICQRCKQEYGEINPYNHDYEKTVTKEPTCDEHGSATYVCKNCNDTYTEPIPATGHWFDESNWNEVSTAEGSGIELECVICHVKETIPLHIIEYKAGETYTYAGEDNDSIISIIWLEDLMHESDKYAFSLAGGDAVAMKTSAGKLLLTITYSYDTEVYTITVDEGVTSEDGDTVVVWPDDGDPRYGVKCRFIPAHTHKVATPGKWESDGTEHWQLCSCGEKLNKASHDGGKATCKDKAVCTTCGTAYGELGAHSFTKETVDAKYLKSAATCTEKAVYYKSCSVCGLSSKGTAEEATFETNALGHDWGEWTSNGDGTHTRTCKTDKSHTETKDCHGGTATCTEKATCTDCGKEYGEKDPANHTGKEEWTITKTKHVKKWSCCGEVTVAEKSHTFGKWVVTKNATSKQDGEKTRTCKVCEYVEKATIQATGAPAKTGDESHIGMWAGILCVSLAGIIALVVLYRKKHKK